MAVSDHDSENVFTKLKLVWLAADNHKKPEVVTPITARRGLTGNHGPTVPTVETCVVTDHE
jgi:hypothetical protein